MAEKRRKKINKLVETNDLFFMQRTDTEISVGSLLANLRTIKKMDNPRGIKSNL